MLSTIIEICIVVEVHRYTREQYRRETRSADWGMVTYDLKSEPIKNMKTVPRTTMMLDPWLPIL